MIFSPHDNITNQDGNAIPLWMEGMRRFRQSGYVYEPETHNVVWSHHNARLLHVNGTAKPDSPIVLLVPSLINRYYILNLTKEQSLARYLAQDYQVYILDWGTPEKVQEKYDAEDYINDTLLPAISHLLAQHSAVSLHLIGYCIGGLLALAVSQMQPHKVRSLTCLATPWDFHANAHNKAFYLKVQAEITKRWCNASPLLWGEYISWLFYLADPESFEGKYSRFAQLDCDSEAYQNFLVVEHWVNDSVPLTRAFAHTCLVSWAQHNQTALLQWRVGQTVINPASLKVPLMLVAPERDRIVPQETALALAHEVEDVTILTPSTGHIGMVIGRNRYASLWKPLQAWLREH